MRRRSSRSSVRRSVSRGGTTPVESSATTRQGSSAAKNVHEPGTKPVAIGVNEIRPCPTSSEEEEKKQEDIGGRIAIADSDDSPIQIFAQSQDEFVDFNCAGGVEVPDLNRLRAQSSASVPVERAHSSSSSSDSPKLNRVKIGDDLLTKPAILPLKPHDYGVQVTQQASIKSSDLVVLAEFNEFLLSLQFEEAFFFQENLLLLFETLYPGLKQVPIAEDDVICLLIFALIRGRSNPAIVASELDNLHLQFDSEILTQFLEKFKQHTEIQDSLNLLFNMALENDCYYTLEAFMAVNHIVPLEDSERLLSSLLKFAQMGATSMIENYLTPELKTELEAQLETSSLLFYLIGKNCRSAKMVSLPIWSYKEIEAAALKAIEVSNWFMFKCLINRTEHSFAFLLPEIVECARLIYSDHEDAIERFKAKVGGMRTGFNGLIQLILQLQSPESNAISAFNFLLESKKTTIDFTKFSHFYPSMTALFSDCLEYLKIILDQESVKLVIRSADAGYMGLWEMARGAKRHDEIMEIITSSRNHQIYHALANCELSDAQWDRILSEKLLSKPLICPYEDLIELYGFDDELLTTNDRFTMRLFGRKQWSLLHLAVLSLNVPAVKALIKRGAKSQELTLGFRDYRKPLALAKALLVHIQSVSSSTHPMSRSITRSALRESLALSHPAFYNFVHCATFEEIKQNALQKCQEIVNLLQNH